MTHRFTKQLLRERDGNMEKTKGRGAKKWEKRVRMSATYSFSIWSTSMTIVKHSSIASRTADISVGLVATTTMVVRVMLEDSFQLVFFHSRTDLAHHSSMSGSRHSGCKPQHLKFSLSFGDTTENYSRYY